MTVELILLAVILGLGIASLLGRTADSRDPEYSVGRLLTQHHPAENAGARRAH